jgi:hypothetical protein
MIEQGYSLQPTPKPSQSLPPLQSKGPPPNNRSTHDSLQTYIDRMLREKTILRIINRIRVDTINLYNPIASIALAIVFFLAKQHVDPDTCKGYTHKWSYYALIFYSILAFHFIIFRKVLRTSLTALIGNVLGIDKEAWQKLGPWLGTFVNLFHIVLSVELFYGFTEREKCEPLSGYMIGWAVIQFIPFISLVVSIGITCFTMVHYLDFEKRRLA